MADHDGGERSADSSQDSHADRRGFLKNTSRAAMTVGLIGGYGGFAAIAGRFLYPSKTGDVMWQFVTETAGIEVGEAIRYRGPTPWRDPGVPPCRRGLWGCFSSFSPYS